MQISKLWLIALLAGGAIWQVEAQSASPQQQQKALDLLWKTIFASNQQGAMSAPAPAMTAPAPAAGGTVVHPATNASQLYPPPKIGAGPLVDSWGHPSPRPPAVVTPAPPEQPGPKTKQQKLMDLLQAYRADRITPVEYQAQRAKILAEP